MADSSEVQWHWLSNYLEEYDKQLVYECSLPLPNENFHTDSNSDRAKDCKEQTIFEENLSAASHITTATTFACRNTSLDPCTRDKNMLVCSFNNFSYRLRNMSQIRSLPSIFIPHVDQSQVDEIDVASLRRKSPSAATNTTTTTKSSATSLDLYSQIDKVVFPLSRYLLNDSPLHIRQRMLQIRSPSMAIAPSTLVDENQIDGGIEVEFKKAQSMDSLIAVENATLDDDMRADVAYLVDCISDLKGQESYSDLLFQRSSQPQDIIIELSNVEAMDGGIPKTFHLIDDDNEINSCMTTSTIGGIASVCSWGAHGERDEPESGPHMLCFHEQIDSFDNDCWNKQIQTCPTTLSIYCDRRNFFPAAQKQERSWRKSIGCNIMSKIQNWFCK